MELREYAATIWKWLWLILLAAAVAGAASWYVVKDQPPTFQTSTTLMIGQAIQQANPTYADFYAGEQLAQTYSELIRREPVLKATAAALGFEGQWRRLKGQVAVSLVPGTQLLEIKVTDTDPVRAKAIADEVARQLIATVEKARPQDENRAFIEEQAAGLPPKIQAAQEEIRELEAELSTAFSARQIQDLQNQVNTLENQINNWQATFAQFQLLLGNTGANVMSVVEEAPLPTSPVGTSWLLQVALAAAIGGMLAVGAAFLLEYLDDTVRTTEEVERVSGLPTLGVIAQIPGERPSEKLVVALHPRNPISEAYRSLRTSLRYTSLDQPMRSLLVTSPHAKEGKSTVLANLAVAMAQAGQSVVVVDSDLRRPMQHRLFKVQNQEGLTTALLDDDLYLNGRLQETGIKNLRVMTSGPLPPNPSELLGSEKMKNLMADLAGEADIVLYDTPPLLPVTDGAVLAARTDAVLLVTEAGRTRKGTLRRGLDQLVQIGAPLVGTALNRVSRRGRKGYYYYYYYYSIDEQGQRVRRRKRQRHWDPLKDPRLAVAAEGAGKEEAGGEEAGGQEAAGKEARPPEAVSEEAEPPEVGTPSGPGQEARPSQVTLQEARPTEVGTPRAALEVGETVVAAVETAAAEGAEGRADEPEDAGPPEVGPPDAGPAEVRPTGVTSEVAEAPEETVLSEAQVPEAGPLGPPAAAWEVAEETLQPEALEVTAEAPEGTVPPEAGALDVAEGASEEMQPEAEPPGAAWGVVAEKDASTEVRHEELESPPVEPPEGGAPPVVAPRGRWRRLLWWRREDPATGQTGVDPETQNRVRKRRERRFEPPAWVVDEDAWEGDD